MRDPVTLILALVIALLTLAEWLFAPHHHPVFPWHHWPGAAAVLAFVSCLVVVRLAKALGRWFLQRPEDFDA
jgi:O-antigen/teichoic acid export membrane protein